MSSDDESDNDDWLLPEERMYYRSLLAVNTIWWETSGSKSDQHPLGRLYNTDRNVFLKDDASYSLLIKLNRHLVLNHSQDGTSISEDNARPASENILHGWNGEQYSGMDAVKIQRSYVQFLVNSKTYQKIMTGLQDSPDLAIRCLALKDSSATSNQAYKDELQLVNKNRIPLTIEHILEAKAVISGSHYWDDNAVEYDTYFEHLFVDYDDLYTCFVFHRNWANKNADTVLPEGYQFADQEDSYSYMLQEILNAVL